jgi:hypothetical protein
MCDFALMENRTPCNMVSFPPPESLPTDPVCDRCSRSGHITIFISPTATRTNSSGRRDEYHIKDVHTELQTQLTAALQSPLPVKSSHSFADDKALIQALKDATSFVMVEHEDAEEQFNDKGGPSTIADNDDEIDEFVARHSSPVKLGQGYGVAL